MVGYVSPHFWHVSQGGGHIPLGAEAEAGTLRGPDLGGAGAGGTAELRLLQVLPGPDRGTLSFANESMGTPKFILTKPKGFEHFPFKTLSHFHFRKVVWWVGPMLRKLTQSK